MKLSYTIAIIIVLFSNFSCYCQQGTITIGTKSNNGSEIQFSENWKADSLGTNGFRSKSRVWDSSSKTYYLSGTNYSGFKTVDIISILGEPNVYGLYTYEHSVGLFNKHTHPPRKTLVYYVKAQNSDEQDDITFVIRKKRAYYLGAKYNNRFEKHKLFGHLKKDKN